MRFFKIETTYTNGLNNTDLEMREKNTNTKY